jgi:hypothetical protein
LLPVPELDCPEQAAPSLEQCERMLDPALASSEELDEPLDRVRSAARPTGEADEPEDAPRRPGPKLSPREQIEALRTAQLVRTRQARAALQEQAGLSSREMGEVDAIAREMNSALARSAEELLVLEREPSSLEMLGAASKVSAVLFQGQAALEGLVGPSISGVDESARAIFSYVELPAGLLELRLLDAQATSTDDGAGEVAPPGP